MTKGGALGTKYPTPFLGFDGREKERKKESFKLLFSILGDMLVGIRRATSESSSTRRGLRVDTKNEGFH